MNLAAFHPGPWDAVLVVVVALQTTVLAYVAAPRWKAVVLTLPFPFTVVTLAVGLPVDAGHVLAMVILFAYVHAIRILRDIIGVPIVPAIGLSVLGYVALGSLGARMVPAGDVAFWSACAGVLGFGLALFFGTRPRAERAYRTSLPVWAKLPIVLGVVVVLVVLKDALRGFASLFPLVSVVGAYESRYNLWTLSRTVPLLMIGLVPFLAAARLTQVHLGLAGGVLVGWGVFLVLLVPLTRYQWRRWPPPWVERAGTQEPPSPDTRAQVSS